MSTRQADPYGRGSYCIVVALHGTDSWQADALRSFRDRVLRRLPLGDRLVDSYYHASPRVLRVLSGHPALERATAALVSAAALPGRLRF